MVSCRKALSLVVLMSVSLALCATAQGATLTVDSLLDETDGQFGLGDFSLREAIEQAVDGDTIAFDPVLTAEGPATIALTQDALLINKSLTIAGPGKNILTIDGGDTYRLFVVLSGDLKITNVTLANGMGRGGNGGQGGGGGGGGLGAGGALLILGGGATAENVIFRSNAALGGNGGPAATNNSPGGGGGGGIGLTPDRNGANGIAAPRNGGVGGDGFAGSGGASGLPATPLDGGNGGVGAGGGGGAGVSENGTGAGGDGGFGGGGGGSGTGSVVIVAPAGGNGGYGGGGGGAGSSGEVGDSTPGEFGGAGRGSESYAQTGGGGGGGGLGGAVFVNEGTYFSSLGCDFNDNTATGGTGGGSLNQAAGDPGQGKGGAVFVRDGAFAVLDGAAFSGNTAANAGGSATDNGDIYAPYALDTEYVVNSAGDEPDVTPGDGIAQTSTGTVTLRAALQELRASGSGGVVRFSPVLVLSPQTITLTNGDLLVETLVQIQGPGAGMVTIDAGGASRHFQVLDGRLDIGGVTLANGLAKGGDGGDGSGGGGGALGAGGSIYVFQGSCLATDVVFDSNAAQGGNGGNGLGGTSTGGGGGGGMGGPGVTADGGSASIALGGSGGSATTGNGGVPLANGQTGGGGGGGNPGGSGGLGGFGGGGGGAGGLNLLLVTLGGAGGFGAGGGGAAEAASGISGAGVSGAFGGPGSSDNTGGGGGGGAGLGGAVFVRDAFSFKGVRCTFVNNTATGGSGGVSVGASPGSPGQGRAGGLFTISGNISLVDPVFDNNSATNAAGTLGDNGDFFGSIVLRYNDIVVNDLGDAGDASPGDRKFETASGTTTLRAAIEELEALDVDGAITFDPALFAGGPGMVNVATRLAAPAGRDIAIIGPGASLLILDAGGAGGIFDVATGTSLCISGMTLQNGGGATGGLITATGDLTVEDCVMRNSSSDIAGGAIRDLNANNRIEVRRTTISETQSDVEGGGIYMDAGKLVLDSVLIFGCESGAQGGGIYLRVGTLFATNTTISTNQSEDAGAGMAMENGFTILSACTIVENRGGLDDATGGRAGGLAVNGGNCVLRFSLIAGNTGVPIGSANLDSSPDVTGTVTGNDANLVGVEGASNGLMGFDIILDDDFPLYGPADVYQELGDNGGPTLTHDLTPGSPAINAGLGSGIAYAETAQTVRYDQRGVGFPRVVGAASDTGAVETVPNTEDLGITVAQAPLQMDPTNGLPIVFEITLSEPGAGFDFNDINFTGTATVSSFNLVQFNTNRYTLTVSGLDNDGTVEVSIPAGAATDRFGRNFQAAEGDRVVTYDTQEPGVILSSATSNEVNGAFEVTATFDEAVIGFSADGVTIANGTATLIAGADGDTAYTLEVTAASEGPVTITVNAGAAQDGAGNVNTVSGLLTRTYDNTQPAVVIGTTATSPAETEPVPFSVTFDEAVTDFVVGDLTIENGIAANFAGSGADYIFGVFPGDDGRVTVNIAAGVAMDAAGNASQAAEPLSVIYDTKAPTVTSLTRESAALTNAAEVDFRVVFSEPVTGVDPADFTIDTSVGAVTGAAVSGVIGAGAEYVVTVSTGEGEGLLSIDVVADGTILDLAGRPLAAPFTSGEVYQVDRVVPTVVLESSAPDPITEASIPVSATFSESVTGFDLGDITVTGGTAQNLAGSGDSYTFDVLANAGGGTVTIDVGAGAATDAAGNTSEASNTLTRHYVDTEACENPVHTADQDASYTIDLAELLRIIQFYNSDTFHCEEGTEDGYAPGAGDIESCCSHASDYVPQDWDINLTELLRLIQFFNSGGYTFCPDDGTEDGYCPANL
jgi:hypothetical protein